MSNVRSYIGPSSPGQLRLPRRVAGLCSDTIGSIPFPQPHDSNGNMTSDPDASLSGMTYNALNLLSGYTEVANGYQTTIEYSASGEKTEVTVLDGNGITSDVKHYYGNLIYDGITLWPTRLLIDGGYVDVTSRLNSISYAYRFYVQDHQGNNRMVTDGSGTVLQVNHYDPYGQLLTSISSTSPVSQYKYGGKEWNPTSLSYDFGARNYLPAVPRWNSMDPLIKTLKPWGDKETVLIPYSYHSDEQTVEEYGVITVRYDDSL